MICRFLCACIAAALVGALAVPAHVAAKPPDLPEDGTVTVTPVMEVLPMPHEVADVTCPYLRQKMMDRQAYQPADPDMGHDVIENLKRLRKADKLLDKANDLARDGLFGEAILCCAEAAELCPGSPCAQRAADTMIKLALCSILPEAQAIITSEDGSEESSEPPACPHCPNFEVGTSSGGGLILNADYPAGGNVYHLRYKQGSLSIWRTPDGGKTKP